MLTLNFKQLLVQLRGVERSLLIAAVLTLGALLYAGNLGVQWWGDLGQANELRAQIEQLKTALTTVGQNGDPDSGGTIQERQQELGEVLERFTFATDDDIIGLVDEISREARVKVAAAGTQEAGDRVIGTQAYRVRAASFRVEGQVSRMLDFIDLLSAAAPNVGVVSSRMGGFGQAPWMILDVEFLLDPQPITPAASGS
jgi:hypothetical protein